MLKSIQRFDKKTREGILSEIVLEFCRPSVKGNNSFEYNSAEVELNEQNIGFLFNVFRETWKDPEDVRLLTITEIFNRLRLSDSVNFQYAREKVLSFIGKEIRGLALNSAHISDARKRLGQKGILPPAAYKTKFADEFLDVCEPLGITKKEVAQVINSPDMFEHFIPEVKTENIEAISLYAKSIFNGADPYSLLVDARREGDVLYVHFAIRVYHSDIDVSGIAKPTDLLREFTNKYGSEMSIGTQKGKLILNEIIDTPDFLVMLDSPLGSKMITRGSNRKLAGNKTEICLAYSVDIGVYADYLRLHGAKVKEGFPMSFLTPRSF